MDIASLVRGSKSASSFSDSPLGIVLKGALAGVAGTLALTTVLKGAQWVESRVGEGHQPSEAQAEQAGIGAGQALAGDEAISSEGEQLDGRHGQGDGAGSAASTEACPLPAGTGTGN